MELVLVFSSDWSKTDSNSIISVCDSLLRESASKSFSSSSSTEISGSLTCDESHFSISTGDLTCESCRFSTFPTSKYSAMVLHFGNGGLSWLSGILLEPLLPLLFDIEN